MTGQVAWLDRVYGIPVERHEIGRPGGAAYYSVKQTGKGVLHTTEGDSVDGALATFRMKGFAPTFVTGEDRIVQCRPLWAQASTLHTGSPPFYCNAYAQVQIEQVGHSSEHVWQLPSHVLKGTGALLAYFTKAGPGGRAAIPLARVPGWVIDGSDLKPIPPNGVRWATNNTRRQSRKFFTGPKGWYAHLEVPDQEPTWHWDCGALDWPAVFAGAQAYLNDDGGEDLNEIQAAQLNDIHTYLVAKAKRHGVYKDGSAGWIDRLGHVEDQHERGETQDVAAMDPTPIITPYVSG